MVRDFSFAETAYAAAFIFAVPQLNLFKGSRVWAEPKRKKGVWAEPKRKKGVGAEPQGLKLTGLGRAKRKR